MEPITLNVHVYGATGASCTQHPFPCPININPPWRDYYSDYDAKKCPHWEERLRLWEEKHPFSAEENGGAE